MKPYLLLIVILISCNDSPSRVPSSILNHLNPSFSVDKEFDIYSGPGVMATDYPIARSLKKSKLTVSLTNLPSDVSCKKGEFGPYSKKSTYYLGSNYDGFTDAVYCKLNYNQSDLPSLKSINVSYTIQNRTKEMLLELDNSYISYQDILEEHANANPSKELFDYFEKNVNSKEFISWSADEDYKKSVDLGGKIIEIDSILADVSYRKNIFSSDSSSAEGIDVDQDDKQDLIDPSFRAYEVVCKFADKSIRASKLESKILYSQSGKLDCFMNIYKKALSRIHKFDGEVSIRARVISNNDFKSLLKKSTQDVSFAHKKRIETIWANDKALLQSMLTDVNGSFRSASRTYENRIKEIKEDKRVASRDRLINGLFKETIDGRIGKGVSEYTLTALEKKYFLPTGELASKSYYLLSNKSHAFYKSNDLNFSFAYEAFADKVKIYFKTDEDYSADEEELTIKICDTYKRSLLSGLMAIQDNQSVSKNDYLKLLNSFNVNDVSVCSVKDSETLAAIRGSEYYLIGNKFNEDKVNIYKLGALYSTQFNGQNINEVMSSFGAHPAKGKSVSIKKYRSYEQNNEVYLKMNDNQFADEVGE